MDRSTAVEKHTVRSGAVAELGATAAELARASISNNTRRAYQSALDRLQAFLWKKARWRACYSMTRVVRRSYKAMCRYRDKSRQIGSR